MIAAHHLVFGRKYGETFTIEVQASRGMHYQFSTYEGDAYIDWGNGTYSTYISPKLLDFTNYDRQTGFYTYAIEMSLMATPIDFTTKVRLNKGFKDVYSIAFFESGYLSTYNYPYGKFFINDFGVFINQFINLKTLIIDISRFNEDITRKNTIKGDLSNIPDSLEKITIGSLQFQLNLTDLYLNVSNFSNTSNLKVFKRDSGTQSNIGTFTAYGNLAKLPSQLYYFKLAGNTGTFTYSGTKVWASSFDTLDLGNASLPSTDTDNLLIDMANSITTAIGGKIIRLANCYRTVASNSAVAYLQSLGYTITVLGTAAHANSKILDLPLQNNFTDTTGFNTMIAGGTSNLPTFTLEGGEYAAVFNGSQSLKTNANFVIGTDKVSISFWMKSSVTTRGLIAEISNNPDTNNVFSVEINKGSTNFNAMSRNTGFNERRYANTYDGSWNHYVIIIDRSLNATDEIKLYKNNYFVTSTLSSSTDNNGVFGIYTLFIGQRAGSTTGFNGRLKFLKIFNYPLSTTEITNLYNKTM